MGHLPLTSKLYASCIGFVAHLLLIAVVDNVEAELIPLDLA